MKRLLPIVILLFICFCPPCFATEYRGQYPKYLFDDEDYIICDCHMGTAWYVDKTSVSVEEDSDDERILSFTVVSATYNDHHDMKPYGIDDIRKIEYKQFEFLYDLNEGEIYYASTWGRNRFLFINRHDRTWRYIDPDACWADVGIVKYAAIEAYRSIYGTGFYE